MSKKCPYCGSIRIVEAPSGDMSICLACESFLNTVNGRSDPTVFDKITKSVETLADKMVFLKAVTYSFNAKDNTNYIEQWISTICNDVYPSKHEAFVATVEELKKEYKNELI